MIKTLRHSFNDSFNPGRYQAQLDEIQRLYPDQLDFRVAETPVFVDIAFQKQMLDTCSYIIDRITEPGFMERTNQAIPERWKIPGSEGRPEFLAFDFGVCGQQDGTCLPQLIELQGFPSLFAYQSRLADWYRQFHAIDKNLTPYLSGLNFESYHDLLRTQILGDHDPREVILLELFPEKQKTRIDFAITRELLDIPVVCLTELRYEKGKLYYESNGKMLSVKRIYNRIIFDELDQQPEEVRQKGRILLEETEVEWCPHPNWFYRISKFLLPSLHHPCIPTTHFLQEVKQIPHDLSQYVLKPLFSFAGQGVMIDPTPDDLLRITEPNHWILQRKVNYKPVIPTPDDPAKVEIRLFYFWPREAERPFPVLNLARLSKGQMVGTRYNKDRSWVGGSICFFQN